MEKHFHKTSDLKRIIIIIIIIIIYHLIIK